MKRFIEGADREQSTLLPDCLDDWIDESNPVRAVDVFVDGLDLAKLGFDSAIPEATGRPSYHPSALLKLYIYGYLNRVHSSASLPTKDDRRLPQGQRAGHSQGVRPVRRPVPRDGPAD
jgi:transposase